MKKAILYSIILVLLSSIPFGITGGCASIGSGYSGRDAQENVAVFPQPGVIMFINAEYNSDKSRIVSGHTDGFIRIWDAESGRQIRSIKGHSMTVLTVAWSPDGRKFLSCDYGTLKLWDAETCREIWSLPDYFWSAAFSPDGRTIAAGSKYGIIIKLLDAVNGREIGEISGLYIDDPGYEEIPVIALCYSPNGDLIAASSAAGTVGIFNAKTGERVLTLAGQFDFGGEVEGLGAALAFSSDGKRLVASQFGETTIHVYDVESGGELFYLAGHDHSVNSAAFSPDGKYIVSGSSDRTVRIWDSGNGKELHVYRSNSTVSSVSFRGERILATTGVSLVELDVLSGEELRSFRRETGFYAAALSSRGDIFFGNKIWTAGASAPVGLDVLDGFNIKAVDYSPDAGILAALVAAENQEQKQETELVYIVLIDVEHGSELCRLSEFRINSDINFLAPPFIRFSPDGKRIISSSAYGRVLIWDTESGEKIWDRPLHQGRISAAAIGPGGRIASCSWDGTLKIWDEQNPIVKTFSIIGESEPIISLAFSPDGKYIAMSSKNRIMLRDIQSGLGIWTTAEYGGVNTLAFNPDGNRILAGSIFGPKILDAGTGKAVFSPNTEGVIINAAYSRDGKYFYVNTGDSFSLWDAQTNREIAQYILYEDSEWIVITPEGYYNASAKGDNYLNIRVGNNVYGVDQYRRRFDRPDIVTVALSGNAALYQAVVREAGANIKSAVPPPRISFPVPNNRQTIRTGQTEITVSINDPNLQIQNVWINVNGRTVAGKNPTRDISFPGLNVTGRDRQMQFTVPIDLENGTNVIEVFAYNGYAEGRAEISFVADIREPLFNLYFLAIGVNEYNSSLITNLSYAVKDATDIAREFKRQENRRYGKVETLLITDNESRKPTAATIRENFSWFSQAEENDLCVLFIAGHAVNVAGDYYFLPSDAVFDAAGNLNQNTAISHREINALLEMPGRKLFILDTCHSAGAGRTGRADLNNFMRQAHDYYPVFFTSSKENELSQESSLYRNGLFTYSIVEGINGAASSRSGKTVTMKSLDAYVSDRVSELSGGRQTPISQHPLGYADFILATLD